MILLISLKIFKYLLMFWKSLAYIVFEIVIRCQCLKEKQTTKFSSVKFQKMFPGFFTAPDPGLYCWQIQLQYCIFIFGSTCYPANATIFPLRFWCKLQTSLQELHDLGFLYPTFASAHWWVSLQGSNIVYNGLLFLPLDGTFGTKQTHFWLDKLKIHLHLTQQRMKSYFFLSNSWNI